MTFQSKIISPSGTALESANVNFRFTILDAAGTCVLYVEDYANKDMTGSQGVVAIPLGSGTKVYPPAAVSLYEVFNNSTASFNCQAGGTSSPTATDNRQVVMQFNDGSGWQTLPQMAINAVPFANYATRAESLGAYAANAYLRPSTLPTCTGSQALSWDGSAFTCIAAGGGGGGSTYTGVTSIANASGDITLAPAAGTGSIRVSSNTPSTSTTTGAVVITGGMGVSGAINAAGNIATSGSVSSTSMLSTTSVFTPQLYGTSTASGTIKIDGTSNATKGDVLLASAGGKVGIGTTTPPVNTLSVVGTANFSKLGVGTSSLGTDENIKFQNSTTTSNSLVSNAQTILMASPAVSGGGLIAHYNAFGSYAWYLSPNVNGGDMTGLTGGSYLSGGGSIVTATGVNGHVDNGGGTISSARAGYFEVMNAGGTNTTGYGVYIGNIAATSKYGLYQSDSAASNYFAGKISVGTSTSTYALNVSGDVNVSGNFRVNGTPISAGGGANQTGVTSISNASGDITLAPAVGTGAVQINSGAASTSPTTGALIVSGGIGVSGGIYSGGAISSGSTVSANTSMYTPQLYGTSTPSGSIRIDGTSDAVKGNVLLAPAGGNVGVGTTSPVNTLTVVGGVTTMGTADANMTILAPHAAGRAAISLGGRGGNGINSWILHTGANDASFYIKSGNNINSSTERLSITSAGNVGIGTTTPSSLLHTTQTISSISGETKMVYNSVAFQPTGPLANGNGGTGVATDVSFNGSQSYGNWYNWGNRTAATSNVNAPASMGTLNALSGQAYQGGDGMVIDLTAVEGDAIKANVGDVVRMYGVRATARNINATGTLSNAYGVHATVLNPGGGTTSNAYGVYVGNVEGTNKWSIYAADTTTPSYFGGNVGIGTTTPASPLTIHNTSAGAMSYLQFTNPVTGLGAGAGLLIGIDASNEYRFHSSNSTPMKFFVNNTEQMRIQSGAIGIGTTSPSYALSVSGDVNVTGAFRVNGVSIGGGGGSSTLTGVTSISNSSGDITMAPAVGTGAVQINSGAASTSPTTGALIVSGGIGVSGGIYSGGAISSGSSVYATTSMFSPQLYGTSTASGNIKIDGTSNAAKGNVLLASAGGKVGIGTSTPNNMLTIHNANATDQSVVVSNVGNATSLSDYGGMLVSINGGGGFHVTEPNIGISGGFDATPNFVELATYSTTPLVFSTDAHEKMRLTAAGSLGIGTTTPQRKLDVVGGVRSSSGFEVATSTPLALITTNLEDANDMLADNAPSGNAIVIGQSNTNQMISGMYNDNSGGFHGFMTDKSDIYASFIGFTYDWGNPISGTGQSGGIWFRDQEVRVMTFGERNVDFNSNLVQVYGYGNADGNAPTVRLLRRRGSYAAQSSLTTGDLMGDFSFVNSQFAQPSAGMRSYVDTGTISSYAPSRLEFFTTPGGTTAPSTRLAILPDGKVGVGTSSPAYALAVSGDVNVTGNFRVNGAILTGTSSTLTGVTSISNSSGDITLAPAAGTNSVRINPGVASTSSTTGSLIVTGGVGVSGALYTGGAINSGSTISATTSMYSPQIYGTSTASGDIKIDGTSNNTKGNVLLASAGGQVGIGTTTPLTTVHIEKHQNGGTTALVLNGNGGANATSSYTLSNGTDSAAFMLSGTGAGRYGGLVSNAPAGFYFDSQNATGTLNFRTGTTPTQRMIIDSTGKVGIGTVNPISNLDVVSTSASLPRGIASSQYSEDTNGPIIIGAKARGTTSTPAAIQNGDSLVTLLATAFDGTGLISPGYIGFVSNGTVATNSIPGDFIVSTGSVNGGSERVRVTSSGNVGIGTNSPLSKLDVRGNIGVRGTLGVGTSAIYLNHGITTTPGSVSAIAINPYLTTNTVGGIATGISVDSPTVTSGSFQNYYGFQAEGNTAAIGNMVGFYSNIPAGNSHYNFYGASTAKNYFAGDVGIGTTTPAAKLHVAGTITSGSNVVASGGAIDLSLSNTHVLQSVGGSTLTLSNMVNGGTYTIILHDQTSRTYSFAGCANTKFSPASGATTASTDTIYGLTTVYVSGAWYCYVTWVSGFQ